MGWFPVGEPWLFCRFLLGLLPAVVSEKKLFGFYGLDTFLVLTQQLQRLKA